MKKIKKVYLQKQKQSDLLLFGATKGNESCCNGDQGCCPKMLWFWGGFIMRKIEKRILKKHTLCIGLYYAFSTVSIGSENCCNGSFACCGATSCH